MITIIIGLLIVVGVTLAYVALRNAQDFSDANEVVPGVPTSAPKAWAGAHNPEARLHRRLRDAVTALRANAALDDPALTSVRDLIQDEALAIDERLVAAAALPSRVRAEPLRQVGKAVDAIEATVADVVSMRGPAGTDLTAGLEAVRARLAFVAEARRELEALDPLSGGLPPSFERPDAVAEHTRPADAMPDSPPVLPTTDEDGGESTAGGTAT